MKKLLLLIFLLVGLVGLAGCSEGNQGERTETPGLQLKNGTLTPQSASNRLIIGSVSATTTATLFVNPTKGENWFNGTTIISNLQAALLTVVNLVSGKINGVVYIDPTASGDFGTRVNAAYASLPSRGGTIVVMNGTTSAWTVPITFATNIKPVLMKCDIGTELNYTNTATSVAITFDANGLNIPTYTYRSGYGMENCYVKATTPVSANTITGLYVGGGNLSEGIIIRGNDIENFSKGLVIGNNSWKINVENNNFQNNKKTVESNFTTNAGENWAFTGNLFTTHGICLTTENCVFSLTDTAPNTLYFGYNSFDDCQLVVPSLVNNLTAIGNHFENPDAPNNSPTGYGSSSFIVVADSNGTNVNIIGGMIMQRGKNTQTPDYLIESGGNLKIDGLTVVTSNTASTSPYLVYQNSGSGSLSFKNINNIINGNSDYGFTSLSNYSAEQTGIIESNFDSSGNSLFNINTNRKVGIGTTTPAKSLHVEGDNPSIRLFDSSGTRSYIDLTTKFGYGTVGYNGTNRLFLNASTFAIGTSTLLAAFQMFMNTPEMRIQDADTTGVNALPYISFYDRTTRTGWIGDGSASLNVLEMWGEAANSVVRFGSANAERMRITSAGYVGIGTTTPTIGLDVVGGITDESGKSAIGYALCYLDKGKLGHCTSVVAAGGTCTCAAN